MLDITQLRKDLDTVVARLATRKNPQTFLDEAAFISVCYMKRERDPVFWPL